MCAQLLSRPQEDVKQTLDGWAEKMQKIHLLPLKHLRDPNRS